MPKTRVRGISTLEKFVFRVVGGNCNRKHENSSPDTETLPNLSVGFCDIEITKPEDYHTFSRVYSRGPSHNQTLVVNSRRRRKF